ncbi:MAG TPA: hypothetical protein VI358_16795 [Pseudolabrys sp.]
MALLVFSTKALAQMESLGQKEPLVAANLSAKEIREIIAGVKKSAYDIPKSWRNELRLRRVDLGNGPGIVVQGTNLLCGATGNCQTWVFRKANANWVSLFADDEALLAEDFNFGPSITRHIKDLTIVTNLSAEESNHVTYKFDGRLYRAR